MKVILNPPSENILKEWQELLNEYYNIHFPLDVLAQAYFMDIGYRMGMLQFSPFAIIDKSNPSLIFQESKEHWEGNNDNQFRNLDTELRESLYENAHFITFGTPAPTYGDK